jgi:hypothetical protein
MTRSWTDPRTGKRWHIDVIRETPSRPRGQSPAPFEEAASASALVFDSGESSYSLFTEDATRLEALEDERLAELLDAAKESPPRDQGKG